MKSRFWMSFRYQEPHSFGWKKRADFRNQPTSHRTGAPGLRIRWWRGRTRSTNSIPSVAGAKVAAYERLLLLGAKRTRAEGWGISAFDPERSLTPLEPPVSAPPDARCCSRPRTQRLPWARQMPLKADRLSRDYRSQVRTKVLGFSLYHRRG